MKNFDNIKAAHNDHNFRAPADLQVTPSVLRRGLFIGSCFAESMKYNVERVSGVPHDYVMYHAAGDLDGSLARPIGDYDYQVIALALRFIVPEDAFLRLDFSDEAACEDFFYAARERMLQWLEGALTFSVANNLLTFVSSFLVPVQNPMGRLLRKKTYSNIAYLIQKLNEALEDAVLEYRNCFLLDLDSIANTLGKKYISDEVMWLFNHGTVINDWDYDKDRERLEPQPMATQHFDVRTEEYWSAIWREIEASVRTVRQQDSIKLVLVDLDDTMWRGIIGEDRLNAVPTEGWPVAFAEALHYLKKRGIILGILSKNDDDRIVNAWDRLYNVIKLHDFAVRRINWNPKSRNIDEVLQDVNLLPRNVLFIDDNPVERDAIRSAYPEVRVLGSHPYYFKQTLIGAPETQVAVLTAESSRRTEMIHSQIERETTRKRMSREEFLASLDLSVHVIKLTGVDDPQFPRAFELLNKTNQFNTTGRRWTIEEVTDFLNGGGDLIAYEAKDKFTQYGLISLSLIAGAEIVQTVMSCRVIGMEVERAVLSDAEARMRDRAGMMFANFVATPSNGLCRDLYRSNGYADVDGKWRKPSGDALVVPSHIALGGDV